VVQDHRSSEQLHIVWIYSGSLAAALDAATWLETVKELRNFGCRVTLVAAGPDGCHQIRGVEVLCISRPEIYLLRQFVFHGRLLRLIMRQWTKVDVVLFHQMSAPWLLPLRILRGLTARRRPLMVMDIRSLHMPGKQGFKDRLRGVFVGTMSQAASRWVDGYLVITKRMTESLRIPSERLWGVWPSGVNLEQFASAQTARRWPLPEEEPIRLIYTGALHYERNLMALCRAVELANAEGMAFRLTLMGDGTARKDLEKFAAQSAGHLRVVPPVPHDEVAQVLAHAHVGILPFPDEEKFRVSSPIKLFEYMAAGLPILATRIVCHTDVVGSGDYAFWAQDAGEQGLLDALRLVWRSRDFLREMGREAAIAAEGWTWRASAEKLKKALDKGCRFLE
jgi:glycosyltransferase involved in cell wall biosynthesis